MTKSGLGTAFTSQDRKDSGVGLLISLDQLVSGICVRRPTMAKSASFRNMRDILSSFDLVML